MASELSMNGRKKIETIQKEFNEKFEFLNLTFFDTNGMEFEADKTLSEIRKTKGDDISIIASLKISSLEKKFEDEIGVKVEVSFKKNGEIVHTTEQNNLTLNELNDWCAQNGCEKFATKSVSDKSVSNVSDDAALQQELFGAIKKIYAEAEAKKIGEDNHLDIFMPIVYPKRGAHLFFNTAKDVIKVGFYCRDEEFVLKVLSNSTNIESYGNGIRILNNPEFSEANKAVSAAVDFISNILNAIHEKPKTVNPNIPVAASEQEEVDLLANFNQEPKTIPPVHTIKPIAVPEEEEVPEEQVEEVSEIEKETVIDEAESIQETSKNEDSNVEEKAELSSLLSKIKNTISTESSEIEEEIEVDSVEPKTEEDQNTETASEEGDVADFSTLLSRLNKVDTEDSTVTEQELNEKVESTPIMKESKVEKPQPEVKKTTLSHFDITNVSTIDKLCTRIKQERILPHLPYINAALEKENYSVDNHVANFFLSKVIISDQNMEGFLYVNMDGFHSNCIDKSIMQPIFSWSGVKDIRYTEDGNNTKIDLVAEQGELTIKEEGTNSLKILHHIYLYAWKEANDKFANESIIIWNVVEEMGIKLNSYPTQEEYIK